MTRTLSRQEASDAVTDLGWRYVLGTFCTSVPVTSLAQATEVATRVVTAAGDDADEHLRMDVRRDRVVVMLQTLAAASVTPRDAELAGRISQAAREIGLHTDAGVRSEEHTSELQSRPHLVCRLLLEKKKNPTILLSTIQIKKKPTQS